MSTAQRTADFQKLGFFCPDFRPRPRVKSESIEPLPAARIRTFRTTWADDTFLADQMARRHLSFIPGRTHPPVKGVLMPATPARSSVTADPDSIPDPMQRTVLAHALAGARLCLIPPISKGWRLPSRFIGMNRDGPPAPRMHSAPNTPGYTLNRGEINDGSRHQLGSPDAVRARTWAGTSEGQSRSHPGSQGAP